MNSIHIYSLLFYLLAACSQNEVTISDQIEQELTSTSQSQFTLDINNEIVYFEDKHLQTKYYAENQEFLTAVKKLDRDKFSSVVSRSIPAFSIKSDHQNIFALSAFFSDRKELSKAEVYDVDGVIVFHTDENNSPFFSIYKANGEDHDFQYAGITFPITEIYFTSLDYLLFEYFEINDDFKGYSFIKKTSLDYKSLNYITDK